MPDNALKVEGKFKLIVTIVKRGIASRVVTASKKAGAEGGTVIYGCGTAKKSVYLDFLGLNFEPEKEIILTLAPEEKTENILQAITEEARLKKPGNGVGFVLNTKHLTGVLHLLRLTEKEPADARLSEGR